MNSDFDETVRRAQMAAAHVGEQMAAFVDAAFPERIRAREEAARLGYQGRRHGWYPEKPRRR